MNVTKLIEICFLSSFKKINQCKNTASKLKVIHLLYNYERILLKILKYA